MQVIAIAIAVTLGPVVAAAEVRAPPPLRLTQTIALPNVKGRIDHLAVDEAGGRLFICALGNDSAEVIDLRNGQRVHSIGGLGTPQGVAYVPNPSTLYVANDKGGVCNIYDGTSFALTGTVSFEDDADNVRYDSFARRIYVGYGEGNIGVIDATNGKSISSIKLLGHPEAFLLEKQGHRLFVNVPTAGQVAVVDRDKEQVISVWKMDAAAANFPMALDEANHRLFIGCRLPAKVVVLNTDTGSVVTGIAISGDVDDIFYDSERHRLYAICGEGYLQLIHQIDADTYEIAATIPTAAGARTGLFVPELNSLFVAVPHRGSQTAEVRRYAVK